VETISNEGKTGTTADFTCFSFYATKNLTTGEGGMVATASDIRAKALKVASLHGISRDAWTRVGNAAGADYDVLMAGFKYNMMDIQAALGLSQLSRLEAMHQRRSAICSAYDAAFQSLPLTIPAPVEAGHAPRPSPLRHPRG
jgi:dTDP-4-amino-4,6-dideoxygalactose transaminase